MKNKEEILKPYIFDANMPGCGDVVDADNALIAMEEYLKQYIDDKENQEIKG